MIAAQSTKVIESNIQGRSVEMSLDVDSLQKIMNRLTDLYSDRILACIREISTNAFDSHVDAGNAAPYEVRLPTPLDPYFRVQDYGTGLTADEFIEVYSKYGKSTRDTSNDFSGMMGLGCKAPLTYTSQYTIYSVKDGVAAEVLITRNEAGTSTVTIVSETPTDEPNGVLVEIMVNHSDVQSFRDRAENFYRFWQPGTVLVDGVEPEFIQGTEVGASDLLIIKDANQRSYVVMGNVPYPVAQSGEWTLNHGLINNHSLVAFVPMGAVSLPPSREGLSEDKHTKDALAAITTDFHARVAKSIQREINNCKSPFSALDALLKWNHMLPKASQPSFADYKFQGRTIPEKISLESIGGGWLVPNKAPTERGSGGMTAKEHVNSILANDINKRIIFTGWDYSTFSATMRRKLDQWVHDNDLKDEKFTYLLLKPETFTDQWFDSAMVFSWDDVKKIKLENLTAPSAQRRDRWGAPIPFRIPGSFDVITESGETVGYPANDIDTDEPIFYHQGNLRKTARYSVLVEKLFPTATMVAVPANREAKFKRDFPTARAAWPVLNDCAKAWFAGLDEDTRRAMHFQSNCQTLINRVKKIDLTEIDDPSFAAYLKYDADNYDVEQELNAYNSFNRLTSGAVMGIYDGMTNPKDPFQSYPLAFDCYGTWELRENSKRWAHFVLYANALYAARQAGADL